MTTQGSVASGETIHLY